MGFGTIDEFMRGLADGTLAGSAEARSIGTPTMLPHSVQLPS